MMDSASIDAQYNETVSRALAIIEPGVVFRIYKRPNPNCRVCHVRAVVDGEHIVYRVWNGKWWVYHIEAAYYFGLLIEDGNLTVIGKDKD